MSIEFRFVDKMVKPILLYGCDILGFGNNDMLKRVHLKFCKNHSEHQGVYSELYDIW